MNDDAVRILFSFRMVYFAARWTPESCIVNRTRGEPLTPLPRNSCKEKQCVSRAAFTSTANSSRRRRVDWEARGQVRAASAMFVGALNIFGRLVSNS
jgi:hypothetical protein